MVEIIPSVVDDILAVTVVVVSVGSVVMVAVDILVVGRLVVVVVFNVVGLVVVVVVDFVVVEDVFIVFVVDVVGITVDVCHDESQEQNLASQFPAAQFRTHH